MTATKEPLWVTLTRVAREAAATEYSDRLSRQFVLSTRASGGYSADLAIRRGRNVVRFDVCDMAYDGLTCAYIYVHFDRPLSEAGTEVDRVVWSPKL